MKKILRLTYHKKLKDFTKTKSTFSNYNYIKHFGKSKHHNKLYNCNKKNFLHYESIKENSLRIATAIQRIKAGKFHNIFQIN